MVKFRLYFDKDREEKFLNEMSNRGLAMEKFFLGAYSFEPCDPGEYTYRVDLIAGKDIKETNSFYDLVRDSGGELVQTWGFWAFYRKKGSFDLYTDRESQISQYEKIRKLFIVIGFIELMVMFMQLSQYLENRSIFSLVGVVVFTLLTIVLFAQVIKCTRKIASLNKI
ncbi:MAG: DUF2812 domain-containing protein [Clostridiaceae bacterium]